MSSAIYNRHLANLRNVNVMAIDVRTTTYNGLPQSQGQEKLLEHLNLIEPL